MRTLTTGIIGCGGFAQNQHLPNITRSPRFFLKTLCDTDRHTLENMQAKYAVPHAVADYKELLADKEIEAVFVVTRDDMQAPLTIEALRAGKHVYVEKPLAESPEVCRQVVEAQHEAGKHVAVGFNRRFAPAYRRLKEIVHEYGGPTNITYRIADSYWDWAKSYNFPPRVRIVHEVCHVFDILRYLTNSEFETIYCIESRADDEIITMKMHSGCVVTLIDSGYATDDLPKERVEVILRDKGLVSVEDYVELHTFGLADEPTCETFDGHSHPDSEFGQKYLLSKLGLAGHMAYRRMLWEQRRRWNALQESKREFFDRDELQVFAERRGPMANYIVAKGWVQAIESFAETILSGSPCENASAVDGLAASQAVAAAIQSRSSGEVVRCETPPCPSLAQDTLVVS